MGDWVGGGPCGLIIVVAEADDGRLVGEYDGIDYDIGVF